MYFEKILQPTGFDPLEDVCPNFSRDVCRSERILLTHKMIGNTSVWSVTNLGNTKHPSKVRPILDFSKISILACSKSSIWWNYTNRKTTKVLRMISWRFLCGFRFRPGKWIEKVLLGKQKRLGINPTSYVQYQLKDWFTQTQRNGATTPITEKAKNFFKQSKLACNLNI